MINLPTRKQLQEAHLKVKNDIGNRILYNLCKQYFQHKDEEEISAKVKLIGRAYAVAIERRKNGTGINEDFYRNQVIPAFIASDIDNQIQNLKSIKQLIIEAIPQVLTAHYSLTNLLYDITGHTKRSFSSKYLHFHLPNLFFLYDSRAVLALREYVRSVPRELEYYTKLKDIDKQYAMFCCKCLALKSALETEYKTCVTIRELDNILIEVANNKARGIRNI